MDNELKNSILKTGTTILGIVCKDGAVIAGDRRGTLGGQIVFHKNSKKAVVINDYLIVAGAGIASDIDMLQKIVKAELRLKELKSKKRPTVKEAASLIANISYKNIRQPSIIPFQAGMIIGGFNEDGTTEIYSTTPGGDVSKIEDYDANLGSGMPYVLGLLERQYKKDLSVEEGVELAIEAIKSSSERDTASGSGIDVFTITKDGIKQVIEQEIIAEFRDRKKAA